METRYVADPVRYCRMTTAEIREAFLVDSIFKTDSLNLLYCDVDRAIVGSAVPAQGPLELSAAKELRAEYFNQRRELGILNIGGSGVVTVDGVEYPLANRDVLYAGRGCRSISFASVDAASPSMFYLISYPAHREYPTVLIKQTDAASVNLGSPEQANARTIFKYIHPDGAASCQLVMGFTRLAAGSVWNTMPPHTHERRMEIYLYFDVPESARVFHLMGAARETRHIVIANRQAVISPSWSIHSGVGTSAYSFCWAMGGENQTFDDMDGVTLDNLF